MHLGFDIKRRSPASLIRGMLPLAIVGDPHASARSLDSYEGHVKIGTGLLAGSTLCESPADIDVLMEQ